ncbi:GNAT family N-acetyltransferase [Streptomyces albidoflavus]|uniref:GNAT family N-acetyltransferase n=1 Tax=Streptomyces TaxID=1883 RepID=UPI000C6D9BCD|nr:GNAT family N-acetyltransferase [Streptomyces sp. EAG2]PKR41424.1 GNAT family N-acetyltransferase [Streptomyces sp. EAG2]WTC05757.1 GNAT family N-acetyltransferase [Streptomyces albidoflavus]WTC06239.1 GNAT family N-acetyltransferase [Streptomyces albidoflavus]WTD07115.1 GNAT family N-acetyltransferase [Streptomyces albidoflavus]
MTLPAPVFTQYTSAGQVPPDLRQALAECWVEVTNTGGAAGFPFPPVQTTEVTPALETIVNNLDTKTSRLLTAHLDGRLAGWLNLRRDPWALISHWGTLHHVQTRTTVRGQGIGAALMNEVRRIARDEMGLEQLHLAARGGVGLETFYGRLGWKEIGRWPGALRLADGEDRDEILMLLAPL